MFRKIIHITLWSVALILVSVSLGFSIMETRKLTCQDVKVAISDSSDIGFLKSNDIEQWVRSNYRGIFGVGINNLKLRKIEEGLQRINAIEEVSV